MADDLRRFSSDRGDRRAVAVTDDSRGGLVWRLEKIDASAPVGCIF